MLHRAIQTDPVRDRDKAFMGRLRYFGIVDGEPFRPDTRTARILTQGANLGELLARANTMEPYFSEPYDEGTQWYRLIDFPWNRRTKPTTTSTSVRPGSTKR